MARTDDLSAWRMFASFAKTGTLTAAAEVHEVEPSTVLRAITSLERVIGQELVVRRGVKGPKLTEAGKVALNGINQVLGEHDRLIARLTSENATLEGRIRLSAPPGFATRQLMPLLAQFAKQYPKISVDVMVGLKENDVASGRCEVAILTGDPTVSGLVVMSRGRNVYLPVATPRYIEEHGMPVIPDDLKDHTLYSYSGPVREGTKALYRRGEMKPIVAAQTIHMVDILAIREALLADMGVAVDMPLVQIWEDLREGRLVPILPGWCRPPLNCYCVTSRSNWHVRRVRVFLEWYARAAREAFQGYEDAVAGVVALPPSKAAPDHMMRTGKGGLLH